MRPKTDFDYLILGAGPAGLQAGYFMEKDGRDYLILEAGSRTATFFETFPRHGKLISINKVNTGTDCPETNLRWDWNSLLSDDSDMLMSAYSKRYFPEAAVLRDYLDAYAERFKLKIKFDTKIVGVHKGDVFELTDERGETYTCERLIIATGLTKPHVPDIPGIEHGESYFDFSIDPEEFSNQRVLIIGKGNSAFETADNLTETASHIHLCSPSPLRLAWKTHYVGHVRAVNNNFLDTYQLKSQNAILDANIESIERRDGKLLVKIIYTHAKGERREIYFDRVLVCAGFKFNDSIFDESCRPTLCFNGKFPQLTSEYESVNVKDLYFAGNLMHSRDYRKTMSGFIHGFRYNVAALCGILEHKHKGREWPRAEIEIDPQSITDRVIERINKSSAMFLQPAYFCDVIVMPEEGGPAHYYEDLPVDYVQDGALGQNRWYYLVTLEYGDFHTPPDPFNIERDPDPALAHLTAYLHPIIRRYDNGSLKCEHHVPEDLENVYSAEKYTGPMVDFFHRDINAAREMLSGKGAGH